MASGLSWLIATSFREHTTLEDVVRRNRLQIICGYIYLLHKSVDSDSMRQKYGFCGFMRMCTSCVLEVPFRPRICFAGQYRIRMSVLERATFYPGRYGENKPTDIASGFCPSYVKLAGWHA